MAIEFPKHPKDSLTSGTDEPTTTALPTAQPVEPAPGDVNLGGIPSASGISLPPSMLVTTEAFARSERVELPFIFQGRMVEDSLLLSEGEVSMEGSKSTVIVVWLVNHSSPSDAPLTEFHERHPYLLRVIRSVITKDPQLSLVPSSALTQEPLGFSHAEGVPEVGAMGITTQVADLNLFEHVKQQIKTLVEKPYDPLVISVRPPEAKRSNLPRGIRAQPAPTKESSLSSEQLSPQQAAQELITFFIDSFCSNDNLASIGKVVKQFEPIASALKEASSPSTLRDKLRTQLTEALPKDVDVQQATAQLDKKIDELRARVKVEQEGAKSGLQQVIEEMV